MATCRRHQHSYEVFLNSTEEWSSLKIVSLFQRDHRISLAGVGASPSPVSHIIGSIEKKLALEGQIPSKMGIHVRKSTRARQVMKTLDEHDGTHVRKPKTQMEGRLNTREPLVPENDRVLKGNAKHSEHASTALRNYLRANEDAALKREETKVDV